MTSGLHFPLFFFSDPATFIFGSGNAIRRDDVISICPASPLPSFLRSQTLSHKAGVPPPYPPRGIPSLCWCEDFRLFPSSTLVVELHTHGRCSLQSSCKINEPSFKWIWTNEIDRILVVAIHHNTTGAGDQIWKDWEFCHETAVCDTWYCSWPRDLFRLRPQGDHQPDPDPYNTNTNPDQTFACWWGWRRNDHSWSLG